MSGHQGAHGCSSAMDSRTASKTRSASSGTGKRSVMVTGASMPPGRRSVVSRIVSGREGCPASGLRARAGPRTAPRAGRRIRRAHVCDERSEEFALAPAARGAEPLRVARAQRPPWDTPPVRDLRAGTTGTPSVPSPLPLFALVLSCSRSLAALPVRRGRGLPCRRSRSARRRRSRRGCRNRGGGGRRRHLPSR